MIQHVEDAVVLTILNFTARFFWIVNSAGRKALLRCIPIIPRALNPDYIEVSYFQNIWVSLKIGVPHKLMVYHYYIIYIPQLTNIRGIPYTPFLISFYCMNVSPHLFMEKVSPGWSLKTESYSPSATEQVGKIGAFLFRVLRLNEL